MTSIKNTRNVRSLSPVTALERRLDDCFGSEDHVVVIRALAATKDRAAIRVLASLLDSTGPIAEESITALVSFGDAAVPAMRGCVEALDYDMIRHAHRVLSQLGHDSSTQWLHDDDCERIAAYLERKGFTDLAWDDGVANEADEQDGVA